MSRTGSSSFPGDDTRTEPSVSRNADPSELGLSDQDAQHQQWRQAENFKQQLRASIQEHGYSRPTMSLLEGMFGAPPRLPATPPPLNISIHTPTTDFADSAPGTIPAPLSARPTITYVFNITKFSGEADKADMFVALMADLFALSACKEEDKVKLFSFFLSDSANMWHHSIRLKSPGILNDYKRYVEAFRAYFNSLSLMTRIRNKFKNLRHWRKPVSATTVSVQLRSEASPSEFPELPRAI